MINKIILKRISNILFLLLIGFLISGCIARTTYLTSTNQYFSDTQFIGSHKTPINVLQLSYQEALDTAYNIADSLFPSSTINFVPDYSAIQFTFYDAGNFRNAVARIEPILIKNLDNDEEYGVIYKINSMPPSSLTFKFFSELKNHLKSESLNTIKYKNYKLLKDKGVVNIIPASIPVTYSGFKKYLDDKARKPFEGIWSSSDRKYTLGMFYNKKDPQFKYHAFIINTKTVNWKPGEIKASFNNLRNNKISVGEYFLQSKAQIGITWKAERELITAVNAPRNMPIALIKTYPLEESEDFISGVGTGWAVSEDGIFVTNNHVIEYANKIYVGFKENPQPARVIMTDKRTDLALIKVTNPKTKYTPMPIKKTGISSNGTEITVVGYPMAFTLGDDPRVTNGIISAQSGIDKDVTRYQISATVQPGSSGGPVIDAQGEVIGVVVETLRDTLTVDVEAVNFAIKSGYLLSLIDLAGVKTTAANEVDKLSSQQIFLKYKNSILPIWTE